MGEQSSEHKCLWAEALRLEGGESRWGLVLVATLANLGFDLTAIRQHTKYRFTARTSCLKCLLVYEYHGHWRYPEYFLKVYATR